MSRPAKKAAVRERLSLEARREQLLSTGRELFVDRPYDQVSMDDVAQRAGVSKALVFHYFSTKRDLYLELVKRAAAELIEATHVDPALPPYERLLTGIHRYLDFVEANARGYAALLTSGIGVDTEVYAVIESARRTLSDRLLAGLPPLTIPDATTAIRGYIGFVEVSSLAWLENKTMTRDELIQLWVRVLGAAVGLPSSAGEISQEGGKPGRAGKGI